MKLAVIGYSGSGKSTLAKTLGARYALPVLYLDRVHFLENWAERDDASARALVAAFLDAHPGGWVIDGNYVSLLHRERLEQADRILLLRLPPLACLFRVIRRYSTYRNRVRESAADGCTERFDAAFLLWVLFTGRRGARKARFDRIAAENADKLVDIRSQRALDAYLNTL